MENPQHSVQAPSVEVADLHVPPLDEVAAAIENGLKGNFLHAEVQVVDCPDLTKEPFHLAASGKQYYSFRTNICHSFHPTKGYLWAESR